MDFEYIKTLVFKKEFLVVLLVILLLLIVLLIIRSSKKKNYQKKLNEFQVSYNSIKSIPLAFKLNKVISIAKTDEVLNQQVDIFNEDFASIQTNFKLITDIFGEIEDNIQAGKLNVLKTQIIDADALIKNVTKSVKKLEANLNMALSPESEQRDYINVCKDRYLYLTKTYNDNNSSLNFADEIISSKIKECQNLFTQFEEQMVLNEYEKAKHCVTEISYILDTLENIFDKLPNLVSDGRGLIPSIIENVSDLYNQVKQKGVYLNHLNIAKNIEIVSEALKQDLICLKSGDVDKISDNFEDYKVRLNQLMDQINKESTSFDEVEQLSALAFGKLDSINKIIENIDDSFNKKGDRYGLDSIRKDLPEIKDNLYSYNELAENIKNMITKENVASSTILISLKEFSSSIENIHSKLKDYKERLDSISSDEERAFKQLLKLQLIMNEIQVKINCYHLPAISEQCSDDINEAYRQINILTDLLNQDVLDADKLSLILSETIDYVYDLYNNVNNIVGMAQMCENTIVFANRYRTNNPDLDSDLTRSELLFKNGEYTEALNIAINALEKLNLDSYKSLIEENAISAI